VAFALQYGGGAKTLQQTAGLSEKVAEEIYNKYWTVMGRLKNWMKAKTKEAYQNDGVVCSGYGRPRRLKWYLTSSEKRWKFFGERSVGSHLIQGLAGDVMRIVLVNLTKTLLIPFPDKVRWIGCVHDEINLAVRKKHFNEIATAVRKIMALKIPGTEVTLTTSVEIGFSYGTTFPFEYYAASGWRPKTL
jgi:DNA polymerase I-like protein with 3'-5' exonuclease and polymerase domains